MRVEDLSKTLDHTVLAPSTTLDDIERACEEAREYHFAALCSYPKFVSAIAERLRTSDVKTCAVISYPDGTDSTAVKVATAEQAVTDGAEEIDIVMNVQALLLGEFTMVRDELVRIVRAIRGRAANDARGDVLVKVIIEAPLLDDKLVRLACKIVDDAGADFAKTCTGVGTRATVHDVETMRDALPERVGVKAAGGVRTLADVQALIGAGAARVGTSSAVGVAQELIAANAS
jgi:deoxyribose-phosphate aldolase